MDVPNMASAIFSPPLFTRKMGYIHKRHYSFSARKMKIIWGIHSCLQSFGFTSFLALFQFTLGSCLWLFVRKRVTHLFTLGGIPVSQESSEPWPLPRLVTYCQCVAPVTASVAKTASLLLFFYLISILEIHICISNTSLSF